MVVHVLQYALRNCFLPVKVCIRCHCNDNVAFSTTLTAPDNSFTLNEALYLLFEVALHCTNWLTSKKHFRIILVHLILKDLSTYVLYVGLGVVNLYCLSTKATVSNASTALIKY